MANYPLDYKGRKIIYGLNKSYPVHSIMKIRGNTLTYVDLKILLQYC